MRILQLSTSLTGGAGVAARNLNNSLIQLGQESSIVSAKSNALSFDESKTKKTFRDIASKSLTLLQLENSKAPYDIVTPYSVNRISPDKVVALKPDVIHIHNWYNLLSLKNIIEIGKNFPIVFTLHDQRLFTGGCHNSHNCFNFVKTCSECPATYLNNGIVSSQHSLGYTALRSMKSVSVISPSNWMAEQFSSSRLGQIGIKIQTIPNVIETQTTQIGTSDGRNKISRMKLEILFIAANIEAQVKGLDILLHGIARLEKINSRLNINLTIVGSGIMPDINLVNTNIVQKGMLDRDEISKLMMSSDLLIVPSRSENIPNVILEAQLNNLLVIGARVGGIPELVSHLKTGILTEPTAESIANSILKYLDLSMQERQLMTNEARENAIIRTDVESIIQETLNVYVATIENFK